MNNKRLVKRIKIKHKNKKKIKIYNKNLNLNLIHTKDISNVIIKTFKYAEGIYNLTDKNKISLETFYNLSVGNKKKIIYTANNYSSNKIFKNFKNLKIFKPKDRIEEFINEN